MQLTTRFTFAAALSLTVILVGCSGSQGAQGPHGDQGAQGPAGANGTNGTSTGTIAGALMTPNGTGKSPVPGATVSVIPDQHVTATTAADGSFSLSVPVGVYTVVFTKNPGITTTQVASVSVLAGGTATVDQSVAYSPIALTVSSDRTPASFSAPVNLTAATTGATGPVTYSWTLTSGPYLAAVKPTLIPSGATASFTTNTFAEVVASNVVVYPKFFFEPRPSFIPISFNQATQMSYTVTVTATDGEYTQTASAKVYPVVTTSGIIMQGSNSVVPVGINLVGNDPTSTSWSWTLTAPAGAPVAKLYGATTQFPSFTPAAPGVWTLRNGSVTLSVTAATYVGMGQFVDPAADDGLRCSTCHLSNPPPEFALWKTSAHGNYNFRDKTKPILTMFQQNFASGHYSGECLACHSVGFTVPELFPETTPPTGNNGFADTMEAVGWNIPTVKSPNAWSTLDPKLKAQVGEQCENCHGPLSLHLGNPLPNAPQPTFAAGTCLVCHDEPGHHEESAWWVKSPTGHSNTQLAIDEGNNANCGRCHAAQGYAAWRSQVKNGVSGDQLLMIPPNTALNSTSNYVASTAGFLNSLGLDPAHVQPQTCEACHDSHMTRLRTSYVSDDPTSNDVFTLADGGTTGLLPAGFTAQGVGKGALCMTCHNSRVGLHGDGIAATDEHGPHTPSQADMLMGQNAYFMSGTLSKHAMVADTCVGCHMKYNPQSFGSAGPTGMKFSGESTNHTFKTGFTATDSVCVNCHQGGLTGTALQGQVSAGLANLRAAILAKVQAATNGVAYTVVPQTDAGAQPSVNVDATNPITALDITSVHGNKALALTLTNAIAVGSTSTNTVTVLLNGLTVGGNSVIASAIGATDAAQATMSKAIWNYMLISNDGSLGVHNPTFALNVLSTTQAKVNALTSAPY